MTLFLNAFLIILNGCKEDFRSYSLKYSLILVLLRPAQFETLVLPRKMLDAGLSNFLSEAIAIR